METKIIARVNNVDIVVIANSEEQLVPIKPICEALGVSYTPQIEKLKTHPIYCSTILLSSIVANDGKARDMSCLPLRYLPGWLFSIHPDNVKEEARENLINYQMVCNNALFNHFFGTYKRVNEQNKIEIELLENLADYNQQKENITKNISDTKRKLEKLRKERLDDEPNLFD